MQNNWSWFWNNWAFKKDFLCKILYRFWREFSITIIKLVDRVSYDFISKILNWHLFISVKIKLRAPYFYSCHIRKLKKTSHNIYRTFSRQWYPLWRNVPAKYSAIKNSFLQMIFVILPTFSSMSKILLNFFFFFTSFQILLVNKKNISLYDDARWPGKWSVYYTWSIIKRFCPILLH